jgi:hypothetical protein
MILMLLANWLIFWRTSWFNWSSSQQECRLQASRSEGPLKPRLCRYGPTVTQAAYLSSLNDDWSLSSSMAKLLLFSGSKWTVDARVGLISLAGLKNWAVRSGCYSTIYPEYWKSKTRIWVLFGVASKTKKTKIFRSENLKKSKMIRLVQHKMFITNMHTFYAILNCIT